MEEIYARLKNPKDAATFASLSIHTRNIMMYAKQRWSVSVTERACDAGILDWIRHHESKVKAVTYIRCMYSTKRQGFPCGVETLNFHYCRIFPSTFPVSLRSLTIHQLVPGENPGCLTPLLNACPVLERVAVTCSHHWGLAVVGPLHLPYLDDFKLTHLRGTLVYHHGHSPRLRSVMLHAADLILPPDELFPRTCTSLSLRSIESFVEVNECVPPSVETLDIVTKGLVFPMFWDECVALKTLTCCCDSFLLRPLPRSLEHFHVNVNVCFVLVHMAPEETERYVTLPYSRMTERYRLVKKHFMSV